MKLIWKILIGVVVIVGLALVVQGIVRLPDGANVSPQEGLPETVEAKRQAIAESARAEDYDKLAQLASAESFNYSFGGPYEGGFAEYLRQMETKRDIDVFKRINTILSFPYYEQADIYVWPAVFAKQAADWNDADLEAMRKIGYDDKAIEAFRLNGAYTGHRIGIREDGEWLFFVAGD